ncbi:hypothetical protein A3K63_05240 [Candidatus Micrarchaeota archaeon RBG_16_49_10]|nr:MAG: hypothetical protein A3K63_05240 [Candidatus Micrarchaeota archaeon RBG_16_49_10]
MQEGLESSDIASLRFDFRGHGESEGPKQESSEYALLRDLTSATDYLMGLGYSPNVIGLFGSSTGARI